VAHLPRDRFVSLRAGLHAAELRSHPLSFQGNQLRLNVATPAGGQVRVELQDAAGKPLPGFALNDCIPLSGDHLSVPVRWNDNPDLGTWQGQTIRLRLVLRSADLYAFQFDTAK
jgi:hypothetical protein